MAGALSADVAFHEDASRIRAGYAADNQATLRHIALNMLRSRPTKRGASIRTRGLRAGWDKTYFSQLLTGNQDAVCPGDPDKPLALPF